MSNQDNTISPLDSISSVRAFFVELDRRHFAGRLVAAGYQVDVRNLKPGERGYYFAPDGTLRAVKIEEQIAGICVSASRLILIHHHDDPVEFRGTLLHEMAHAAVELDKPLWKGADQHGRRFVGELRRLRRAGEECLINQVRFYSLSQGGWAVATHRS